MTSRTHKAKMLALIARNQRSARRLGATYRHHQVHLANRQVKSYLRGLARGFSTQANAYRRTTDAVGSVGDAMENFAVAQRNKGNWTFSSESFFADDDAFFAVARDDRGSSIGKGKVLVESPMRVLLDSTLYARPFAVEDDARPVGDLGGVDSDLAALLDGPQYDGLTAVELRKLAAEKKIAGRWSMKKDELIAALKAAS